MGRAAGGGSMGAERPQFLGLRDMFDGGGRGRSGDDFEGGLFSGLLNGLGIDPLGYRDRMGAPATPERPMARPSAAPRVPAPVTMMPDAPAGPMPGHGGGEITTSRLPDPIIPMAEAAIQSAEDPLNGVGRLLAQARRMVPEFDRLPPPMQQHILRQIGSGGGVTLMNRGR